MPQARWGEDPEFFGPRHEFREGLILAMLPPRAGAHHLECAAGLGSLAQALAGRGFRVVAADASWKSLMVARRLRGPVFLPVVADVRRLPFPAGTFASASSAETLEHVPEDQQALAELFRVLQPGGRLVGSVPADPRQWSAWDDWAGHLRRYRKGELNDKLRQAGFAARVRSWGFPLVRVYDRLFLQRVNLRRLELDGPARSDTFLRRLAGLARHRWLVALVRLGFQLDRLFLGSPWGVGLLFSAVKPAGSSSDERCHMSNERRESHEQG